MYRLDLLRHGQTTLSHTLRGSTDDELTELGWQQMQATVEQALHGELPWQVIFSSPLQRCRLFAEQLQERYQLPLFLDAQLQEMDFGCWEGKTTAEIYQHTPELLAKFWETPTTYTPPQAESIGAFRYRIESSLNNIQQVMQQHQYQSALVITHGGVIKLLKCMAQQQHLDQILSMTAELGQLSCFELDTSLGLKLMDRHL